MLTFDSQMDEDENWANESYACVDGIEGSRWNRLFGDPTHVVRSLFEFIEDKHDRFDRMNCCSDGVLPSDSMHWYPLPGVTQLTSPWRD